MDDLKNLPIPDGVTLSPTESQTLDKYFPSTGGSESKGGLSGFFNLKNLKLVAYTVILFAIFSNSWIDVAFSRLPYSDSITKLWIYKIIFFTLSFSMMIYFTK